MRTPASPDRSVVVPFFNEEANVARLVAEIRAALSTLPGRSELVLVDDGSTDATARLLREASATMPACRVLSFAENQGQAAALYTGLQLARGEVIVTLDGDGQNDPADIPALLERLDEGWDMVVGIRAQRQDRLGRRVMSRLANRVRARVLRDGVTDSGCALKVMRRAVVSSLIPIRTLYSFMPAMAAASGFRVTERPVRHRPRTGGRSNYGLRAFWWRPLVDMLGMRWFIARALPLRTVVRTCSTVEEFGAVRREGRAP